MKKFLIALLIIAALGLAGWYLFSRGALTLPPQIAQISQEVGKEINQAAQQISTPPPLRGGSGASGTVLTQAGVVKWTNIQRQQNGGLPALTVNAKLNESAQLKLKDMFAKQYFEHVSPSGIGPDGLANEVGYAYASIGENLALGNFASDQALVQAWMDSPGHRANILNKGYTEIGVAVGKGVFEGHTTWLAVQEFGRPISACPQPDAALKAKTTSDETLLNQMEAQASQEKADIDATPRPRTKEESDAYNQKVDAYNALVAQINALIQQIQGEITVYNGQVQAFNACVQQ